MTRILLTGASGNIGKAITKCFCPADETQLLIPSRTPGAANEVYFDFENLEKSKEAIKQCDVLFLLRPPQLANVAKYFKPLIDYCKIASVKQIVFLSVQGAEKISFIPHAKIEKLIVESGIAYTFLRPGYFMQNLTTAFKDDIQKEQKIEVPAGKAKFLWTDADDIGCAAATVLTNPVPHRNKAYTLTGTDLLNFDEVCMLLSTVLGRKINYVSPNLFRYYRQQKKNGQVNGAIVATMLIHFLQRFQKAPEVTEDTFLLTGKHPHTLSQFISWNKNCWL